ncbi:MAG: DUF6134 family protein [Flavobacteriales bacterium]
MLVVASPRSVINPSKFLHLGLLTVLLGWASLVAGQESHFKIFKGDSEVGSIQAHRSTHAGRTSYVIVSYAEVRMIWMQAVRTTMYTEYEGGLLRKCFATVSLNGNMRDSSNLSTHQGERWAYVHPQAPYRLRSTNDWTTSRMYYEEPIGQSTILVESVLQDCPIRRTGPSSYEVTLPNNDRNRYRYKNGRLMEVQVDRLLVNLVFRRV